MEHDDTHSLLKMLIAFILVIAIAITAFLYLELKDFKIPSSITLASIIGIFSVYYRRKRVILQEKQRCDSCFSSNSNLLGNENESSRIAGIQGLYSMAKEYPTEYLERVCEILCAHIRTNKKLSNEIQTIIDLLFKKDKDEKIIFNDCKKNLDKVYLCNITFYEAVLNKVQFYSANLNYVSFASATLTNVDFKYATLNDITFESAKLADVDFKYATLINIRFEPIDNITFEPVTLTDVDFSHATLDNVDSKYIPLKECNHEVIIKETVPIEPIIRTSRLYNRLLP